MARLDSSPTVPKSRTRLNIAGLFSGIGGMELGLTEAGHVSRSLCEIWKPARRVLASKFPDTVLYDDVSTMPTVADIDVLVAGFPCTDLSQVGGKAGIGGTKSGLVDQVFRLAKVMEPSWIVLENVPNMLVLHRGAAMRFITAGLEKLGYRWAYRTVDARFTGLPQRRLRVVLLASRHGEAPEDRLLPNNAGDPPHTTYRADAYGFYWTEGRGGVGWAQDAIPTLKGGSTIGLASPPALWIPSADLGRRIVMPTIADGERLQGFPVGWTDDATAAGEPDHRWKLLGNAVPVDIANWIGEILSAPGRAVLHDESEFDTSKSWPQAAYGSKGVAIAVEVSAYPRHDPYRHLLDTVDLSEMTPLSNRATSGFLRRLDESGLSADPKFHDDLDRHVRFTRPSMPRTSRKAGDSWASSAQVRRRMQATLSKDTGPELELRRALFRRGLRYRIHTRAEASVRNRIDIVFPTEKVAVDVRGCFWHACGAHRTSPRANAERWASKLEANRERDGRIVAALTAAGWIVIVVWEHEDVEAAAAAIDTAVRSRRSRAAAQTISAAVPA